MHRLLCTVAVGMVLVTGACGKRKSEVQRGPADAGAIPVPVRQRVFTAKRTYSEHVPQPKLPQQREVVVETAGKGPRRSWRYAPDDKPHQLLIAARVESRQLAGGAWSPRVALPEIRYGLGVTRASAPADSLVLDVRGLEATTGDVAAADSATVEPIVDEFLSRYRAHVERRRASLHASNRGQISRLELAPDAAKDPRAVEMEQEILQLALESVVPLPAEPVGRGARWRVTTVMRRGPGVVTQRAQYELMSVEGNVLRVRATITQIGEHQILGNPTVPGPVAAELVSLFWQARGELEVSPASLVPVRGALDVELRAHSRVVQPAGTMDQMVESIGKVAINPQ